MKLLVDLITRGTRTQSIGLLAIGGSMLICSLLAETQIADWVNRELAQAFVIVAGLGATIKLFRSRTDGQQR